MEDKLLEDNSLILQLDQIDEYTAERPSQISIQKPERLSCKKSIFNMESNQILGSLSSQKIEGYIFKYSPSLFKGWQKRYVILKDRKLVYKKTKEQLHPNGVINFDFLQAYLFANYDKEKLQFQIKIKDVDRSF